MPFRENSSQQVGFQFSNVGPDIPSDWKWVPLGYLCSFKNGVNAEGGAYGSGIPFANVLEVISNTHLRAVDIPGRITLRKSDIEAFCVRRGDVLFNRTSETQQEIGLSALYDDDEPIVFGGFVIRARFVNGLLDPVYAGYGLRGQGVRVQIMAQGQGAIRANISQDNLSRVFVPVPPMDEQHAIAEVLLDVDTFLAALEALLVKKRSIKKATMQQLLTGETRLPGFSGEWVMKRLEQLADCLDNHRVPLNEVQRAEMVGPYPYCGANGILDYVKDFVLDDDVILIAEDGGHFDEYEDRPIAYRMAGRIWVNNHAHILKAKGSHSQGFLYFSLVHKNIVPYLSSGTRAKLNKSEMNKIEILFPKEEAEQNAIANILSDIDSEIAALEARRDKTRAIKQAMMQQLLTGRIRLVKSENSEATS